MNEIIAVKGMVCSGVGISHNGLVEFYNKNGYPTYENDGIIYKEIE